MVHSKTGALALVAALLLSTAAFGATARAEVQRRLRPDPAGRDGSADRRFRGREPRHRRAAEQLRPRRLQDRDPQLPDRRSARPCELVRRQPDGALREGRPVPGRVGRLGRPTSWTTSLASAKASMTIDGKQWGVPYTYYQWGIYFNKDAYKAAGVDVPEDLGRVRRQLREVQGGQHRLPDHRHQGAVARGGHLRLPVAAHQRLRVAHGSDRRQDCRGPTRR